MALPADYCRLYCAPYSNLTRSFSRSVRCIRNIEMVISCSAFNCMKRRNKESDLPFHRFPLKHPELLKKWITSVKRKGFNPTSCSFLCRIHFRQDEHVLSPGTWKKRLKPEAVPSVFDFPTHLMPPNKQPRRHVVRILSFE